MPETETPLGTATERESSAYGIARIGKAFVGIPIAFLSEVCQVVELRPLLIRSPYLWGGVDLRGHLIPVINLNRICGLDDPAQRPTYAVVVRRDDRLLAVLVDEVMGITSINPAALQELEQTEDRDEPVCVTTVFLDANRLVSVADIDAIFSLPGVYSVKVPAVSQTHLVDADRIAMLTFEVGGAQFSVPAVEVYGTVPRQVIEVGAMTSGFCLGSITYHQRKVPVISTVDVLGVGRKEGRTSSEVVVLRCPNDRLLGLAVDAIQEIQRIDPKKCTTIPGFVAKHHDYLSGILVTDDASQKFILAVDRLLQDAGVAAIAGLSSDPVARGETVTSPANDTGRSHLQSARYLVIQAGRTLAVPLEQITSIIAPPRMVVPAPDEMSGLIGVFAHSRESIPLVDLNVHLQLPRGDSDMARVLLTGETGSQVGFQVERVSSIETSTWRFDGWTTEGTGPETVVQLGTGQARRALPVINLVRIAEDRFSAAPGVFARVEGALPLS